MMLTRCLTTSAITSLILAGSAGTPPEEPPPTYLPNAQNARIVSVSPTGQPAARIIVQTQAVAIKETGPKETVARFGEVYAFAPAFLAVRQGEPTMISFRNLQPDDEHDFMLVDPAGNVLMRVVLPPLQETSYVFTFHRAGLFTFYCTMHQPDMSGQILVLAPKRG